MNLKAICLMLIYLILAAVILYFASLVIDRLAGASRADGYNIYVRTHQEVGWYKQGGLSYER